MSISISRTVADKTALIANRSPKSQERVIIRKGHPNDAKKIGEIAAKTYYDTELTKFLSPKRDRYYSDYERGIKQRAFGRMTDPHTLTFVACLATDPRMPIGFIRAIRLGDDEGAKKQIASRKSAWLWVLGLLFPIWCKVMTWVLGPDRSADPLAVELMDVWSQEEKKYWGSVPERRDRWHVQSCVVSEEFQGRGVGTSLIKEVLTRAEAENVIVGLEASASGEKMYKKLGFELLERFKHNFEGGAGGLMMWSPPTPKKT
jgi:ribosomal protein S18 acetylase RimI-like enzyme